MRLVAITSASKPSIAINATQRAIKARIPSCMARPPEPRRPQRTNGSIPSIFGGEIGTGMRRVPQNLRRGPAHRRQHRQAAGFARRPRPPARIRHAACPKQRTAGFLEARFCWSRASPGQICPREDISSGSPSGAGALFRRDSLHDADQRPSDSNKFVRHLGRYDGGGGGGGNAEN